MSKGKQKYAIDRAQLAKRAKPLGELITGAARSQRGEMPTVPQVPHVKPSTAHKRGREAPVLRACLRVLHSRKIFSWRNNSGTLWTNGQPVSFGYPGSPDIIGILPDGRFFGAECKSPTGHQSKKQKAFEQKVKANGGVYLLVRSVEDLERGLDEINA